ncbi:MAG: hypothetical protein QOI15_2594 [Pseudonocardiales bacterium]|nr:hypothetical protein [Pseudonocardiales bacterium]
MTEPNDPLTDALRESLRRHAADAPAGDSLAERIMSAASAQQPRDPRPAADRRGWRTWTLPLIAAGAVAGVVAAVVGIENFRPEASHNPPGNATPSALGTLPTAPTSNPATLPVTPSETASTVPSGLTGVRIADLTFVGDNDGWALGSADCVSGPGRCTAMWRTTDGHTWASMPGAQFNVPGVKACADPCVQSIRFANDQTGYAFGPEAFFMTEDGGRSWAEQSGGALALETLDNNVIRITANPPSGCPGPCNVTASTSAIGSDSWTKAFEAPDVGITTAVLARGDANAYLLLERNTAGGGDARSTLYRSADDGHTWVSSGEPCPQLTNEDDSIAIAAGGGGRATVLCQDRGSGRGAFVITSDDAGATFTRRGAALDSGAVSLIAGDPNTVLVAAGARGLARSTDGWATWRWVSDVSGEIGFVGFESETVGRAVSADGTTIWTTRDGGATWRPAIIG